MKGSRQTDGRMRRAERTRASIVDAHVRLLREGTLKPSAKTIAEAAGVSVRTLWLSFGDMESLFAQTVAYWFASDDALRVAIDPALGLEERIDRFCAGRARRLTNIAPAARAAQLMEPTSSTLRGSRRTHIENVLTEIDAVFATEIAASDDPAALRDALLASSSWNAWAILHDDLGRSVEECEAAMRRSLTALLASGDLAPGGE
ncbi:hypothetical protein BHE97_02415 [Aeromicrobium sp. PE09-221]|uniref:TetR/AcrR family transcriptional regulator n=1 Tax=Aeromicrobium sp. PE09-221 TaxID=1898043 RepID=UPI000B3E6DBC|nr:TetR/AcrR family transcriptional regulator [Aeromicrobium sp. PE09-221]OUZ12568.1 hypothetical protein BHE97_02415 [Aeromicrobium sp. PE09-221]